MEAGNFTVDYGSLNKDMAAHLCCRSADSIEVNERVAAIIPGSWFTTWGVAHTVF